MPKITIPRRRSNIIAKKYYEVEYLSGSTRKAISVYETCKTEARKRVGELSEVTKILKVVLK